MTTTLLGWGQLRSCLIAYRIDVTRQDAEVIPLGVMADLAVGPRYGIGLRSRRELSQAEAEKIGGLARPLLCKPHGVLKPEFDRVQASASPGEAFAALPSVHATALVFFDMSSETVTIPRELIGEPEADALRNWIMDRVRQRLDEKFLPFVDGVQEQGSETAVAELSQAA